MRRSSVGLRFASLAVAGVSLFSFACANGPTGDGDGDGDGDTDGPADHRAIIPEAPAADVGRQFLQPELVIPKGEERMTCWVPDWIPDRDYLVQRFEGVQSPLGHHVVALQSGIARDAGETFDCTNLESMTSLEPLVLPDPTPDEPLLPTGYAVTLPADARIVIQSHYVNYTDDDIVIADVARFFFVPEAQEASTVRVSYLIANHAGFVLPEGPATVDVGCTIEGADLNVIAILGHMHELGKSVSVRRTTLDAMDMLYEVDAWTVEFRDEPPLELHSAQAPLVLSDGDALHVTCEYDNDTGGQVAFPQEMCTSVMYYFPARPEGIVFCDDDLSGAGE